MRVMVIVKATKESEAENNPFDLEGAAEMFEAMGKFNEELIQAGIMLAGDGLKPSKFGKRIHRRARPPRVPALDLAGAHPRRSRRVGPALPEPDAGAE